MYIVLFAKTYKMYTSFVGSAENDIHECSPITTSLSVPVCKCGTYSIFYSILMAHFQDVYVIKYSTLGAEHACAIPVPLRPVQFSFIYLVKAYQNSHDTIV